MAVSHIIPAENYFQLVTPVMSCNTHVTFSDKLQLVPSHSTHYCHFHMTSEIPRTCIQCLNLDAIKSQPCSLLVQVSLLVLVCLCIPVSLNHVYIALLCSLLDFQYPRLMICSLIPYIRFLPYMIYDMFKSQL